MAFGFICGIIVFLVLELKRNRKIMVTSFLILLGSLFIIGNLLSLSLGSDSNSAGLIGDAAGKISGDVEIDKSLYEQSSMAALLVPHNPLEFLVFGIVRSLCYVLITPSMISNPLSIFSFSSSQPPGFANWTTIAMFLTLPLIGGMYMRYRHKSPFVKLLLITTLIFFLIIGMFNTTIIHPRYRVVYELLYFSITIIAYVEKKHKKAV